MVTVEVDEDVWRYLTMQKNPGDSYNDVLRRELEFEEESTETVTENKNPDSSRDLGGSLEDVIARIDWGRNIDDERGEQEARRLAKFLRDNANKRWTKSELQEALAEDLEISPGGWWDRAALPFLQHARETELIEYRSGYHDYRWVG